MNITHTHTHTHKTSRTENATETHLKEIKVNGLINVSWRFVSRTQGSLVRVIFLLSFTSTQTLWLFGWTFHFAFSILSFFHSSLSLSPLDNKLRFFINGAHFFLALSLWPFSSLPWVSDWVNDWLTYCRPSSKYSAIAIYLQFIFTYSQLFSSFFLSFFFLPFPHLIYSTPFFSFTLFYWIKV